MKNLSKKKDQSGFLIYSMIQSSANNYINVIKDEKIMRQKYSETVKSMLENIKKINDKNNSFEELKSKLYDFLEDHKLEDFRDLISKNNFDAEELVNEKKQLKKITLAETSELNISDSSTKIDKLEISLNKEYSSSTRNFNLISPNQKGVSNTDTYGITQDINNDDIKYKIINRAKLPHLRIGVVITLSSIEIKRIFIEEMRK